MRPHRDTTAPLEQTLKVHNRGNKKNGSCTPGVGMHPREAASAKWMDGWMDGFIYLQYVQSSAFKRSAYLSFSSLRGSVKAETK